MGTVESDGGVIYIAEDLPPSITESTILHEIIHAISDNLNLDLNEVQVHGLECGLYECGYRNAEINKNFLTDNVRKS